MDTKNQRNNEDEEINYAVMPRDKMAYQAMPEPQIHTPMASDSDHVSIWRSKTTYVVAGLLVLVTLGALAYFLLGSTSTNNNQTNNASSKLPKVFLQQYFKTDTCTEPGKCGDEADPDTDGLNNYAEFIEQTDPTKSDTDQDGLADGDEVNVYLLNPIKKFTDPRSTAQENGYTDGSQIKNEYDPLTPGLKMTEVRKKQIKTDQQKFGLHEPTVSTLAAPQPKTVNISIINNKFDPSPVTIKVNDTVIWLNKDTVKHQIASDPHPAHTGLPDLESGTLATNQTYSYKFTKTGTFTYHDHINPSIKGIIIVQ